MRYLNTNLKRGHIKIGNSIINVKKNNFKEKSLSPEKDYTIVEKKIINMNFDKVKPLKFKF